jgi:transposase
VAAVAAISGVARSTIGRGLKELAAGEAAPPEDRVGRTGGGRKATVVKQPGLVKALTELIQSAIRGDPEADLLGISKSQRYLAKALVECGYAVSHKVVGRLLKDLGFSLQANAKTREGGTHPDRDAQFELINKLVKQARSSRQPAISADTKRKELVDDFKSNGCTVTPQRQT